MGCLICLTGDRLSLVDSEENAVAICQARNCCGYALIAISSLLCYTLAGSLGFVSLLLFNGSGGALPSHKFDPAGAGSVAQCAYPAGRENPSGNIPCGVSKGYGIFVAQLPVMGGNRHSVCCPVEEQ